MRVYKCDVCGGYYDKKMFQPIEVYNDRKQVDICTDCYKNLEKWMGVNYDEYFAKNTEQVSDNT